jgi:hypothetical protein
VLEGKLIIDVEIKGTKLGVVVIYTDIAQPTSPTPGIATSGKFSVSNGHNCNRRTGNINTIMEAVDLTNPGIVDRPGAAVTLVVVNLGAYRP